MILVAHILGGTSASERREEERHSSGAVLSIGSTSIGTEALVSDLSRNGMRLNSSAQCEVGSTLSIEIPDYPPVNATVVWREGDEFGCQFEQPLSRAALSAFILRSPVDTSAAGKRDKVYEQRLGVKLDPTDISDWIRQFERENASLGRRIAGFRIGANGEVVVLISEAD